jgi:hypothetical protein
MKQYNEDFKFAHDREQRRQGLRMGEQLFAMLCGVVRSETKHSSLSALAFSVALAHCVAQITRHVSVACYEMGSDQMAYLDHVTDEVRDALALEKQVITSRDN